jgi:hypothetical protein
MSLMERVGTIFEAYKISLLNQGRFQTPTLSSKNYLKIWLFNIFRKRIMDGSRRTTKGQTTRQIETIEP